VVRADQHVVALETVVLKAFSDARPCKHKICRPPPAASVAEAARLRGIDDHDPAHQVVIDLASYAAVAAGLNQTSLSTTDNDFHDNGDEEMA
jgi:hypothetical protein